MSLIVLGLQIVLALVFVTAAIAKAQQAESFLAALRLSHLPEPIARGLAVAVPLLELLVAFWLILAAPAGVPLAFLAAAAMLVAFTAWMGWVQARRLRVRCACFGAGDGEVGQATIGRNIGFIVLAVLGWLLSSRTMSPLPGASPELLATVVAIALSLALVQALRLAWPELVLDYERFQRRGAAIEGE